MGVEELLKQFEYNKKYKEKLRAILIKKLREKSQSQIEDSIQLKKKLTELENQLEKIEERFILNEIKAPLYEKYKEKYSIQITAIRAELEKNSFDSSNLDLAVKKMLTIAENISQTWVVADYDEKQKLQYLIFPEGILYNKEKDRVRTKRVNSLFAEIPLLTRDVEEKKKGNLTRNCPQSNFVPETGFEPARRFQRHHLKVVRLPISPPGQIELRTRRKNN